MSDEQAKDSGGQGGGNKLVLILTLVNVLVSGATIGLLFMHFKNQQKPQVEDIVADEAHGEADAQGGGDHGAPAGEHGGAEEHAGGGEHGAGGEKGGGDEHNGGGHGGGDEGTSKFGRNVVLEEFYINLASVGSVQAKYVKIKMTLSAPNTDVEKELNQKMPHVRNVVIDLFNSKKSSDLATPEGRSYLKDEIKNAINSFLVSGKINDVFFTDFAVSS